MSSSPPGWYPDLENSHRLRWWDGAAWSESTSPLTQGSTGVRGDAFQGKPLHVLTEPRSSALARLLSAAVGVGGASFAFKSFPAAEMMGASPFSMFRLVVLVLLGVLAVRVFVCDRLEVYAGGVQETVWPRGPRRARWEEIAEFHAVEESGGMLSALGRLLPVRRPGHVLLRLQPAGEHLRFRRGKRTYADYGMLLSDYGADPAELAATLEGFRLQHLGPPPSKQAV